MVNISDFKETHKLLKAEHKKANHIVYALRKLEENGQIFEKSTDDGEPKGCGGMPVLARLRGENIINSATFVVRYFGGIKLGTGGMVRAYGEATKSVIDIAQFYPYKKEHQVSFESSYSDIRKIEYHLRMLNLDKVEKNFEAQKVLWTIFASDDEIKSLKLALGSTIFEKDIV